MQQVWRKDVIRHYAVADETIPVMLLGLKRDLREEGEGVIYPQEVSGQWSWLDRGIFKGWEADGTERHIGLLKRCGVTGMRNVRRIRASL